MILVYVVGRKIGLFNKLEKSSQSCPLIILRIIYILVNDEGLTGFIILSDIISELDWEDFFQVY